jgi:hypothetical protein
MSEVASDSAAQACKPLRLIRDTDVVSSTREQV